jgi:uncharacterized protein RhaS with RHS repeats
MYSVDVGRFLQPDPIGYWGGFNIYSYTHNSPINYTDSFGLINGPEAVEALFGIVTNSLGIIGAIGLALVPEPTLATKVAAIGLAAKSGYGFGSNVNMLFAALGEKDCSSTGALTNDISSLIWPGSQTAQSLASAADLSLDLAFGRLASNASLSQLGRLNKYGIERVAYGDPLKAGKVIYSYTLMDIIRINYSAYGDFLYTD